MYKEVICCINYRHPFVRTYFRYLPKQENIYFFLAIYLDRKFNLSPGTTFHLLFNLTNNLFSYKSPKIDVEHHPSHDSFEIQLKKLLPKMLLRI